MKGMAIFMFFISVVLIVAHGKFDNEFLRISILCASISFTYYAYLHWLVRIIVSQPANPRLIS